LVTLRVAEHPLLQVFALRCRFAAPLGEVEGSAEVDRVLREPAPCAAEERRALVRALLRHGGYKPSGRGKPSSEYLVRAAQGEGLPRINPAVDLCNAVSVESGLPISVVDLARTRGELSIACAAKGASYVFNASGQEIDLGGLLCLFDAEGPCANAVKDAQRTKTDATSTEVLFVVWCPREEAAAGEQALTRIRQEAEAIGAEVEVAVLAS
jgi:DNA/RNA-binding domain of Phe-tRNA-synthetase-like protein